METLIVKVKSVKLLLTEGMDIINIILDEESSFPYMNFDTVAKIECQKDYGETYCKNVLGLNPVIINIRTEK